MTDVCNGSKGYFSFILLIWFPISICASKSISDIILSTAPATGYVILSSQSVAVSGPFGQSKIIHVRTLETFQNLSNEFMHDIINYLLLNAINNNIKFNSILVPEAVCQKMPLKCWKNVAYFVFINNYMFNSLN